MPVPFPVNPDLPPAILNKYHRDKSQFVLLSFSFFSVLVNKYQAAPNIPHQIRPLLFFPVISKMNDIILVFNHYNDLA